METGLVLEGGGMRGLYTAGVLDVLMENGVWTDGTVGVSAGAAFGCNYQSRQIGRVLRYNLRYGKDPRYMSLRSLFRTGDLFGAEFCYRTLPDTLDPFDTAAFAANPAAFWVVCTDVRTGKPVYHRCRAGDAADIRWMRASASMPLVSRPVSIDGRELLDGGIADPIPIEWFRAQGYGRNLVVLTRPAGYRKKKSGGMPLFRTGLRRYPAVVRDMEHRHTAYNRTLDLLESLRKAGDTLVLCPSRELHMGRVETDPARLQALYQLGRGDTAARLEEIRTFFADR